MEGYGLNCGNYKRNNYRGAGKSFARPGRKQTIATEDVEVHITYL